MVDGRRVHDTDGGARARHGGAARGEAVASDVLLEPVHHRLLPVDLLLQLQKAVDERFCRRRAAGHVDVDRHDAVAAAHDRVRVVIVVMLVVRVEMIVLMIVVSPIPKSITPNCFPV